MVVRNIKARNLGKLAPTSRMEPTLDLARRRLNAEPGVRVYSSAAPPPPPTTTYKRLPPVLKPIIKAIDWVEMLAVRRQLSDPTSRARLMSAHGYAENQVPPLYRGVSAGELRELERNGWRYEDNTQNAVKFTTPNADVARAFMPPGGAVVELNAREAVRWYEVSQSWSRPQATERVREHVVPLDAIESVKLVDGVLRPTADTVDSHVIDRKVRAGQTVDVDLFEGRQGVPIEQIDLVFSASYEVPDPSRGRTPEGKPFYRDGVYATTYVVDQAGRERRLERENFVDFAEEDNLHDLGFPWSRPKGEALRVKFEAKFPEGENHEVDLREVRVHYRGAQAAPQLQLPVRNVLKPGESWSMDLPEELKGRRLVRVEARWTDMLSGTWEQTGRATGTLLIDGQPVGARQTVQSPETQSFDARGVSANRVGISIADDPARLDWVRVYFED